MLKVAIIGAGAISKSHLGAYQQCTDAEVVAIADLNEATAKAQAEQYQIPRYCCDYHELLADETIDAVSIVTPGFTHGTIVKEALLAGKHVLCEKPPCISGKEAEECAELAQKTGKLLMWAMVCRFTKEVRFLKDYIEAGNMGKVYYAEAGRVSRCNKIGGWFVNKEKSGGGMLIDGAIHELDQALYLMGYPKAKMVSGFTSHANQDLPDHIKGLGAGYRSMDTRKYERTVETMASGYVHFENGACLYVKAAYVMHSVLAGSWVDITGEKAGARSDGTGLNLVTVQNGYLMDNKPVLTDNTDVFEAEINHFVDCCINGTPCICPAWHGAQLMKIISAIYESAETGMPVYL